MDASDEGRPERYTSNLTNAAA